MPKSTFNIINCQSPFGKKQHQPWLGPNNEHTRKGRSSCRDLRLTSSRKIVVVSLSSSLPVADLRSSLLYPTLLKMAQFDPASSTITPACQDYLVVFDSTRLLWLMLVGLAIIVAASVVKQRSNQGVVLNYSNNRHIV